MFHSPQLQACINRFDAAKQIPLPATMPNNLLPVTSVNWAAGSNQSMINRVIAIIPKGKMADGLVGDNPNFDTFNVFNHRVV